MQDASFDTSGRRGLLQFRASQHNMQSTSWNNICNMTTVIRLREHDTYFKISYSKCSGYHLMERFVELNLKSKFA